VKRIEEGKMKDMSIATLPESTLVFERCAKPDHGAFRQTEEREESALLSAPLEHGCLLSQKKERIVKY
jgi:hypothetical protein